MKFYGEMYFWDWGGGFLGYVWEGMIYTIYSNKSELKICKLAYFISELHKVIQIKKEVTKC